MIKSFVGNELETVEKAANDFMVSLKKNLPVQCTMLAITSPEGSHSIIYSRTVFYDAPILPLNEEEEKAYDEIVIGVPVNIEEKKASNKIGALWDGKGGVISGKMDDSPDKIVIPEEIATKIRAKVPFDITIRGNKVTIIKNKFKKDFKHPEWVIMTRKE